jgi:hypothetical protein
MANGAGVRVDGDSNIGSMKKFNGTNFQIWKFQMTIIKLLGIVEGTEALEVATTKREWKQCDNITMMLICSSIDKKYMSVLVNCKTSTTMWIRLIIVHEENSGRTNTSCSIDSLSFR